MTTEQKFTAGPWTVVHGENNIGEPMVSVVAANGDTICDNEPYYPARLHPDNAPIIASAPDLFEALKEIAKDAPESMPEDWRGCGNEDDAYSSGAHREHFRLATIAKAALLKAGGV